MADARLQDLIAQLRDPDPDTRAKACIALQKLGDPAAITDLTGVYRNDNDAVVKAAAADALRHFARKEGGGGGSSGLRNLALLLTLSLVVLIGLNVMARMGAAEDDDSETEVTPQTEPSDRDMLLEGYLNHWGAATADMTALRGEWSADDETLPCTAELNRPESLIVQEIDRQTYPDIAFVDEFNAALTDLQNVTADWDAACASGEAVTESQVTSAASTLSVIEGVLNEVAPAISNAMANPAATNPPPTSAATATSEASPTPEATLEPTAAPTRNPALDPVLRDLERIISNTESELNALINSKWRPWQDGNPSPFGCAATTFDEPYTGASADLLAQETELSGIIETINNALTTAQGSADLYKTRCDANTLNQALIADGIAQAESALASIQSARDELNRLYP